MIKDNATEAVMRELNASYGIMTFDELLASTGYSPVELASAIGVLTAERKNPDTCELSPRFSFGRAFVQGAVVYEIQKTGFHTFHAAP